MNLKIKEIPLTIRDLEVIEEKLWVLRKCTTNKILLERINVRLDKVRKEINLFPKKEGRK